jgi:response regulator RpfG family c-di-GMP phosphodiesterase
MNTTAEIHETLVELEQTTGTQVPKPAGVRPRIQRTNARLRLDPRTERLSTYTLALAQAMGLATDRASRVEAAAALHGISRINTPVRGSAAKTSRQKTTAGTSAGHPQLAADLIGKLHGFEACVPIIRYHHECYNGSGYPEGLKGNRIPLEARLLAVTDWFTEATTDQPDKPALPIREALDQLQQHSGTRFDPAIVTVFANVINSGIAGARREEAAGPRRRINR